MIPSLKTITSAFGAEKATEVRRLMERFHTRNDVGIRPTHTLAKIDQIIKGYGVEYIGKGRNQKSPSIMYVNMGDTYDTTVMWVRGRFVVGDWGSIVERGDYP